MWKVYFKREVYCVVTQNLLVVLNLSTLPAHEQTYMASERELD